MNEQATLAIAVAELRQATSAVNSLECWKDITQAGEREIMRDLRHAVRHARNAAEYLEKFQQMVKDREV